MIQNKEKYALVEIQGMGDRWLFKYWLDTKKIEWRKGDWFVNRISSEKRKEIEKNFLKGEEK